MKTGVYKITNLVNGKVYIGASKDIERRWGEHKRRADSPIHSDLEALGEENFKFEILLECPEDMLCQWERDMICLYDADDPEKGYNDKNDRPYNLKAYTFTEETKRKISEVRKGQKAWNKGLKNIYSDETKRKISEAHKGKFLSDETKRKMSEAHKGQKAWNRGISPSDETRRKLSEAHKGKPSGMKGQVAWNRGLKMKPVSEETKRKISEARRLH